MFVFRKSQINKPEKMKTLIVKYLLPITAEYGHDQVNGHQRFYNF